LDECLKDDQLHDECGVFGIYGPDLNVAQLTYYGIFALQHRGQESAGIAVSCGKDIELYKNMGLVTEVFDDYILEHLDGDIAVGHVRYSTSGGSSLINAQPLVFNYVGGKIALAHNGNITNAEVLRQNLAKEGSVFQTTADSEVIVNLMAREGILSPKEAILRATSKIKGAYSLVMMTQKELFGLRDPHGVRPLCLGKLDSSYIIASESCALDVLGAEFIRDIQPGEMVMIDKDGIHSFIFAPPNRKFCIFEYVYLARADSIIDGKTVNLIRRQMGRILAKESAFKADIIVPVPDSGTSAALGYAEEANIPFQEGLIKNRYVGRTFIQPSQEMRELGVRLKLNTVPEVLKGKSVILVDDSIVRGTTSRRIVRLLKKAGATKIYLAISSPPIRFPCYYGIDTSTQGQLIAARYSISETEKYIGAEGIHYLSIEGMLKATGAPLNDFCTACFDGNYPIEVFPVEPPATVRQNHVLSLSDRFLRL